MKLFLTMHFKTLLLFTIITMQCLGQAKKDSSIIFREHLTGGAYNVVFIESNKESRFYKKILNALLDICYDKLYNYSTLIFQ